MKKYILMNALLFIFTSSDSENYFEGCALPQKGSFELNFNQLSDSTSESVQAKFPNNYIIAPGADYSAWNGAILVGKYGGIFGVRVDYYCGNEFFTDRNDVEKLLTNSEIKKVNRIFDADVIADNYSANASYAKFQSGEMMLEWCRKEEQTLFCRVTAKKDLKAHVEMYNPYNYPSVYSGQNGEIHGKSVHVETFEGGKVITGGYAIYPGRSKRECDETQGFEYCRLNPSGSKPQIKQDGRNAFYETYLEKGERLYFSITIGETNIFKEKAFPPSEVDARLLIAEKEYHQKALTGTGELGSVAEPAMNEFLWMNTYFPYEKTLYFPPGRAWMGDGKFNIWGWDESFNGIIASYLGNQNIIENQFLNTLGDERIGLFSIWKSYSKFSDRRSMTKYYQAFKKIYQLGDSTLVLGLERNSNVGKGMDDTPMREIWRGKGEMYSLDMSSMKCWSLEILSYMASEIGLPEEVLTYRKSNKAMIKAINETFWNKELGIYLNRYLSGEWPISKGPTSFYPLLCGAPTNAMAQSLMKHLTNEKEFWGKYVIPSLSKDDQEYGKPSRIPHGEEERIFPPYVYWRGAIWPMSNYIVYEGLKRYQLDDIASQFAQKSIALWYKSFFAKGWSCENYNPESGERTQVSSQHQSWSQLMPLMGIIELVDSEPWQKDAIMFGTLLKGENTLNNLTINDYKYSVVVNDQFTELYKDGILIFRGEGGKFNVRNFMTHPNGAVTLRMNAKAVINSRLSVGEKQILFSAPIGIHDITVNGEKVIINEVAE